MIVRAKKIAVLLGGSSSEREVSLRSGAALVMAYQRLGLSVVSIDTQSGRDLPAALLAHGVDIAVIALHGPLGEDGTIQGLLQVMGIPYTGSAVTSSALCMDKLLSKRILRDAGLPTPPWQEKRLTVGRVDPPIESAEGVFFVKPACAGSSVGIQRVEGPVALSAAIIAAARSAGQAGDSVDVLWEQEIVGTEVTLSILDGEPLPLIEIRPESGFYDYQNKYTPGLTRYLVPTENISKQEGALAVKTGVEAGHLLGCRGLFRVDMIVDRSGCAWVLEVNTVPGLTETSLAPKAAAAAGLTFDALAERILAGASLEPCCVTRS